MTEQFAPALVERIATRVLADTLTHLRSGLITSQIIGAAAREAPFIEAGSSRLLALAEAAQAKLRELTTETTFGVPPTVADPAPELEPEPAPTTREYTIRAHEYGLALERADELCDLLGAHLRDEQPEVLWQRVEHRGNGVLNAALTVRGDELAATKALGYALATVAKRFHAAPVPKAQAAGGRAPTRQET